MLQHPITAAALAEQHQADLRRQADRWRLAQRAWLPIGHPGPPAAGGGQPPDQPGPEQRWQPTASLTRGSAMDRSGGVARRAVRARLVAGRIGAAPRRAGHGRTKLLRVRMVLVLATMSLAVSINAVAAGAQAADPPITTPPPAGATPPPATAIIDTVDPVTPCSGWSLQSAYGGRWPTQSTWWEYTCAAVGAREPSGSTRTDYYYWDGPHAASVYYGQRYLWYDMMSYDGPCMNWWDQAANQWYGPYGCSLIGPSTTAPTASFTVTCTGLSCSFNASASSDSDGTIQQYAWDFGDGSSSNATTTDHTYGQAGTYTVQLTVTDDHGETGTATKTVAVAGANAAPTASFTVGCAGLDCRFDAGASADSDGSIQQASWDFGDGSRGGGLAAQHAYAQPGSYLVTLTVTDNAGATATNTTAVGLIGLVARDSKVKGVQQVELAWNGSAATNFDISRNGANIATVAGSGYTDKLGQTGPGRYTYQVCQATTSICSNQATVNF